MKHLHDCVIQIIDELTKMSELSSKKDEIDQEILTFLAKISLENGCFPDGYITDFELARINIKNTGTLCEVTRDQSKLLIGMFIILRTLIISVLLGYFDLDYHDWEFSDEAYINMKMIAAYLYHLFVMDFQETMPRLQDNLDNCPEEN